MEVGGHDVSLKAVDELGRENLFESRIYIAAQPGKDEEYNPVREDRDGLFLIDARLSGTNVANISNDNPITGFITGDMIRTAELEPVQENFTISKNGNQFTISPMGIAPVSEFSVKITTNSGIEYSSDTLTVGSDYTIPELVLEKIKVPVEIEKISTENRTETDENGEEITVSEDVVTIENQLIDSDRIQDTLILKGSFSDDSSILRAEITFSGSAETYGGAISLETEMLDGKYHFDQELDLISLPEGEHFLTLTIEDSLNNSVSEIIPLIVDRTKPILRILSPSNTDPVEGIITVSGEIDNFIDGGEVLFSGDGKEFIPIEMSSIRSFSHNIDLSEEGIDSENFIF